MSEKSNSSSGGIGFCGALFLVFLTLKLVGVSVVAEWSWWWVCAPLWLPLAIVLLILLVVFIIKIL